MEGKIKLPCGSTATFDSSSGISYVCDRCFCVVGSVSQPRECVNEEKRHDLIKSLGGKGWDYSYKEDEHVS